MGFPKQLSNKINTTYPNFWIFQSNSFLKCVFKNELDNALNNVVDFNFLYIDIVYISVLTMFIECIWLDYEPHNKFEGYEIHFLGLKGHVFSHLVNCLYSLELEFVAPNVGHMCKNIMPPKNQAINIC